jgi:hypothetical protein
MADKGKKRTGEKEVAEGQPPKKPKIEPPKKETRQEEGEEKGSNIISNSIS